jgi:hypothetical protein
MANNEITCGNSYSTLWHVTAYLDEATAIALSRRRPSSGILFLLRSIVLTLGPCRRDRRESGELLITRSDERPCPILFATRWVFLLTWVRLLMCAREINDLLAARYFHAA